MNRFFFFSIFRALHFPLLHSFIVANLEILEKACTVSQEYVWFILLDTLCNEAQAALHKRMIYNIHVSSLSCLFTAPFYTSKLKMVSPCHTTAKVHHLTGMELTLFTAAHTMLWFGFAGKTPPMSWLLLNSACMV